MASTVFSVHKMMQPMNMQKSVSRTTANVMAKIAENANREASKRAFIASS
jgi:hypothetical protein